MNELAAIKAVANKAWTSQQKGQKQNKQGEGKKGGDGKFNKQQQNKGPGGPCFGCGGTGHFIKDCPNPHKKSLNSKGGHKNKPPCQEEGSCNHHTGRDSSGSRRQHFRGWARTGLEPEVAVYLNYVPLDAILDIGSSLSLIDTELCESLCLKVNPFSYDISQCVAIEGACLTNSLMAILGWVEVEMGIPGLGCMMTRFWVADTLYNKEVPVVLGSHQIKKVFGQANLERIGCWPQTWKVMYERCAQSKWYSDRCQEDFYDSNDYEEDSFEILPECEQNLKITPSSSFESIDN